MDIQHYYTDSGNGEPLILLHGNGEDSRYFSGQIQAFSGRYRVIAVDSRGHGKTPRGEAPFTIRQFAEDLAGFLDRLHLQQVDLLGFSDGANIAMCFAFTYPERVKKLILNGGNLAASGIRPSAQIPVEIHYRVLRCFAKKNAKAAARAEILGLMVGQPNITPAELSRITAKTLVIAGTKDVVKRRHTIQISNAIKNAEVVFLEGDHFVSSKDPEAFNRAVEAFLMGSSDGRRT